jgi:Cu-Zn family superoxide dismutase
MTSVSRCFRFSVAASALLLSSFAMAQAQTAPQAAVVKAVLKDKSGKDVGEANLTQTKAGVLIRMSIKGVEPGEHAFHVHAVGKCEAPFTSAGPHFNPENHKHGLESPDGAHAGDMPNLHVPQNGDLSIEVLNAAVTLAKGQPNSLLDADGSALVIHAKPDDNKTDPAGDAGDRIVCGVVTE